jgi:hypothetical protein
MQPRGVRHKKEDVEQQSGPVMLVWGNDAVDQQPDGEVKQSAEIVKLVSDEGDTTG